MIITFNLCLQVYMQGMATSIYFIEVIVTWLGEVLRLIGYVFTSSSRPLVLVENGEHIYEKNLTWWANNDI